VAEAAGTARTAQAAQASPPAQAGTPVPGGSIPFSVADPATSPRPVVTVAIGGVPLLLLLDTGSTGIRVTADRVPAKAVRVTGTAATYGYGSGVRLHGDRADADVVIGGYRTGPLPIELVRSTDCFPDKRSCPAADGAKPAMFGGVLDGVLGVSLEAATGLVNPMWTLRDPAGDHVGRQFAVRFAPDEVSGAILLNVPATGYGLVRLPKTRTAEVPDSWDPRAVHTCLAAAGIPTTCGPAMFDSGTPNFILAVPGARTRGWPAGRTLRVGVPQAGWTAAFTSGPGTGVIVTGGSAATGAASTVTGGTLLGFPAFAKGPIRFDLAAGTIGFPVQSPPAAGRVPLDRSVVQTAPAVAPPAAAPRAAARHPAARHSAPKHSEPKHSEPKHSDPKHSDPKLPFHKTAKKAARLPDTGVPMSAALGAVTALTALLAGIGTLLAARRRTDREA
jgi:hypothetical protein